MSLKLVAVANLQAEEDEAAGYLRPDSGFTSLSWGTEELTMPGILLGDEFPNFEADTTIGRIKFHDFLGDS